jgi:hypothetical protein
MAAPANSFKGTSIMSKSFTGSFSNLATLILAVVPLAVVAVMAFQTAAIL